MTDRDPAHELLIEDFRHFSESHWRNDEVGEKRFNFFLTFVTAVMAGLVALRGAKEGVVNISKEEMVVLTNAALWSLFGLGILTFVRLLQKNQATDEYLKTLKYIRAELITRSDDPQLKSYDVPKKLHEDGDDWLWKLLKGGLAGTTGALNGALLAAALWQPECKLPAVIAGVLIFLVSWGIVVSRRP